jgi:hypothetical protein
VKVSFCGDSIQCSLMSSKAIGTNRSLVSNPKNDVHIPQDPAVSANNHLLIRKKPQSLVVDQCKRCLQSLRRILSITWSHSHPGRDGSTQVVDFLIVVNNTETRLKGIALLDTGSDLDWISSEFACRFGMVLQNACREQIAVSITGEPVYSLGVIEARWHCADYPCRPRFEVSTFHVVDSPCTDIGIGKETLERTGMYRRKFRLMAPQRCPIPPLPGRLRE